MPRERANRSYRRSIVKAVVTSVRSTVCRLVVFYGLVGGGRRECGQRRLARNREFGTSRARSSPVGSNSTTVETANCYRPSARESERNGDRPVNRQPIGRVLLSSTKDATMGHNARRIHRAIRLPRVPAVTWCLVRDNPIGDLINQLA